MVLISLPWHVLLDRTMLNYLPAAPWTLTCAAISPFYMQCSGGYKQMTLWCAMSICSRWANAAGLQHSPTSSRQSFYHTAVSQADIFISTTQGEPGASLWHGSQPCPFVVPNLLLVLCPWGKVQEEASLRLHKEEKQAVRMKTVMTAGSAFQGWLWFLFSTVRFEVHENLAGYRGKETMSGS